MPYVLIHNIFLIIQISFHERDVGFDLAGFEDEIFQPFYEKGVGSVGKQSQLEKDFL